MTKEVFDATGENAVLSNVIKRCHDMAKAEDIPPGPITKDILASRDYHDMCAKVERHFGHKVTVLMETRP